MSHRLRTMLKNWFTPQAERIAAAELYSRCVTQARHPFFYRDLGVPDTVDGRFDLLVLHLFLLLRRLKPMPALGSALTDVFFADMDQNLRQMGVADPGVGKRIRKMVDAFYGRIAAYEMAYDDDISLSAALQRNLYGASPVPVTAPEALLAYTRRAETALTATRADALGAGKCDWPQI
ncbi:MAG: ubiquinol-cytochrome C chaperone family protein [Alphaproteobacteria bacterium]